MNTIIKIPLFIIFLFSTLMLLSCSEKDNSVKNKDICQSESAKTDNEQIHALKEVLLPFKDTITVMVIPCSNGYEYNMTIGDLDPSLEKYLKNDNRILLKPFPYKKMNGSGYFGVFDKKYCSDIIENVDVDFLIMTRMEGTELVAINSETGSWGYETKVLNVKTMQQIPGIKSKNLKSFEKIDSDIEKKINDLIELIVASSKSK